MNYDFDQLVDAFEYLDVLRESGAVNMFGATDYLVQDLDYDRKTARELLQMWMKSYDGELSAKDRAFSFEISC